MWRQPGGKERRTETEGDRQRRRATDRDGERRTETDADGRRRKTSVRSAARTKLLTIDLVREGVGELTGLLFMRFDVVNK